MRATTHIGDALDRLRDLRDECVQCVVTSPPYWGLRDYLTPGQLGLEKTPEEYIARMVEVFREVRRVLRSDGTLWLNMGDSYYGGKGASNYAFQERRGSSTMNTGAQTICSSLGSTRPQDAPQDGLKPKDLCGVPWMLAFALRADGWWLRQDIIWSKSNPMPESVTDRCTKAHEYLFLLSKSAQYYFNAAAIAERRVSDHDAGSFRGGCYVEGEIDNGTMGKRKTSGDSKDVDPYRNKRSVWEIATQPFAEAHFATFPEKLVEPCTLAGSKEGDVVLDPFCGSGTTGVVALRYHRDFVGIELNPEYAEMAERRIGGEIPLFAGVEVVRPKLAAVAGD